ncbi:carcinoembryonic antigen-related cell adhesion molecule 21-like [Sturnira hondurensis]|uniref:carcinoembryonic antigen-related cell adhesion molecule 21-like n=1 Tax=Sturnira hondurensis TaxID=192404 RepID=UPI001879C85C|nr:carcinoembryonic antigen-related cell adhesion molecule 21-like [Sturnira hondurensis]
MLQVAGWIEAYPMTRETADTAADSLLNHIIPRFGLPSSIQSDNGPGFISQVIQQVSSSLGITWKLHIPYHPQSSAQENIWVKNAAEGEDVHLRILNMPPDVTRLAWYRGKVPAKDHIIAFLAQTPNFNVRVPKRGQMILNSDGSLLLKKVAMQDTGTYTIAVERENSKLLIGYGLLRVFQPVRMPILLASNTTVTENKDTVVMTCYSNAISTQWLFNGMNLQLTERMKLSEDHRSLTIDPVKREYAGNYKCKVSNTIRSVESAPLVLTVKSE